MKTLKLLLLFTFVFAGILNSQTFNKPKLDSLFSTLAEKDKAMGSFVFSKNGKVIYSRAIGYSYKSGNEKKAATTDTKYRIGSISKMFTAVMIFQLAEEGKITLETTLDKYFPGVPNAGKITIGNLLNHRSGIHNITNDPDYTTWMTKPKTHDEMVAIISKNKPDFNPGEKTSYSNSNFILLGYIIEKITGQSYPQNLEKRITSKIGLKNTYYGKKSDPALNESFSYNYLEGWKQMPETDMSIPGGAGSIISTPTDLTIFIEALFGGKLVSQTSLNQMKTITDGLGMGMIQISFNIKKGYGHNGSIDGFGSIVVYFPEDSLSMAYCTNGQAYPVDNIVVGAVKIYFNSGFVIPTFKTFAVKPQELDKYTGVYSSKQIGLKITVTKNNSGLSAQATGQSAFPLEAVEKDKFKFETAGIQMEFNPIKNEMTLKQGGGVFLFTKDK